MRKVQTIRDWYMKKYPDDELGPMIADISFAFVWQRMQAGGDFYYYIDVADSVVRERVFARLAKLAKVPYQAVYNVWMSSNILKNIENLWYEGLLTLSEKERVIKAIMNMKESA